MTYTDVFGGSAIYPSDVSYLAINLSANVRLEWPLEVFDADYPAARIIDVLPGVAGLNVSLPDATLAAPGETILFNNVSGSESFEVRNYDGSIIATVGFGSQWQVYLSDNTTTAGTWQVFRYGASTANVQPSSLAGFGLTVTGSTLSQSAPVTTFNTPGTTLASSNRASLFVWTGTGAGTVNLPDVTTVGNNFFIMLRNQGGGALTVDPAGGTLINGAASLNLQPGDSITAVTDGSVWYTVGFGQNAVFAFDYTAINVAPGGDYILGAASPSELNRIAYKFTGALTSNVTVVVPGTIQQYWVNNATTGPFTLSLKTPTGTPAVVNQGAKGIYYSDGTNIILAADPISIGIPVVVSAGGTGATTPSAARLNLGITAFADPIVTATTPEQIRTVTGAAESGVNEDITVLRVLQTIGPLLGTYLLEVAGGRTDDANTGIDLHSSADPDYDARIIREGGVNGNLGITNKGTGSLIFVSNGAERFRVQPDGATVSQGSSFAPSFLLSGVPNAYFAASGAEVILQGNVNCFLGYNRTTGVWRTVTNGAETLTISQTQATAMVPFRSAGEVRAQPFGAFGGSVLNPGDASHSGYLALYNAANARVTYIGFVGNAANSATEYINEIGGGHHFNNNMGVDGRVTAGEFYGPGTGLTGTAASLNVNHANTSNFATSANGANFATSAGNADTLDGFDSSAFMRCTELVLGNPGRMRFHAPGLGTLMLQWGTGSMGLGVINMPYPVPFGGWALCIANGGQGNSGEKGNVHNWATTDGGSATIISSASNADFTWFALGPG